MIKLKKNMGTLDRTMRIVVGSSLLIIGPLSDVIVTDTFSNVILACMGGVALASAALSYCFLYEVTGFDTSNKQS